MRPSAAMLVDLRSPQLDWDGVTFDVCGLCQQRVAKAREAGQGSF